MIARGRVDFQTFAWHSSRCPSESLSHFFSRFFVSASKAARVSSKASPTPTQMSTGSAALLPTFCALPIALRSF